MHTGEEASEINVDLEAEHKRTWINEWRHWVQTNRQQFSHLTDADVTSAEAFLQERLRLKEVAGTGVIFIDWDRELYTPEPTNEATSSASKGTTTHPGLELLIAYPKIQQVMVEYFPPELKANIRKNPLVSLITRNWLVENDPNHALREKFFGFDHIVKFCQTYQKDILVGDISNHPNFVAMAELPREAYPWIWAFAELATILNVVSLIAFKDTEIFTQPKPEYIGLMVVATITILNEFFRSHVQALEPNSFEDRWLDLEDSRRVFLANAIYLAAEKLAKNHQSQNLDQTAQTIKSSEVLVIYPPHHNNRVVEKYLDHPPLIKQLLYKATNFYFDYTLRHYSSKHSPDNSSAIDKHSGWYLLERTKIPLRLAEK